MILHAVEFDTDGASHDEDLGWLRRQVAEMEALPVFLDAHDADLVDSLPAAAGDLGPTGCAIVLFGMGISPAAPSARVRRDCLASATV